MAVIRTNDLTEYGKVVTAVSLQDGIGRSVIRRYDSLCRFILIPPFWIHASDRELGFALVDMLLSRGHTDISASVRLGSCDAALINGIRSFESSCIVLFLL